MLAILRDASRRASRALGPVERKVWIASGVALGLWFVATLAFPVVARAGGMSIPLVATTGVIYLAAVPMTLVGAIITIRWSAAFFISVSFPMLVTATSQPSSTDVAP